MRIKTRRRKVIFATTSTYRRSRTSKTSSSAGTLPQPRAQLMSSTSTAWEDEEGSVEDLPSRDIPDISAIRHIPSVPSLFTTLPPIKDSLITETSDKQKQTVEECLPFLTGTADASKTLFDFTPHGVPRLERDDHVEFLTEALHHARYIAYDPSRPWVVYWALTGLSLLSQDVKPYRQRVIETFTPAQNATGGFGGGHGQISHSAPSYAVILSLATVGYEALEMVDRYSLWLWLGETKQADGGFKMCIGGEEDVRGAYCSMVMISLLALPLDLPPNAPARSNGFNTFIDGLPEYLSRCQTFEGGISCGPQSEAHGAYAFCVLACLCILGPPHEMVPKYLNLPLLISWLSARQYAPEGGFSGRTNKLVDGCYSHWVGGCWPLIRAALEPSHSSSISEKARSPDLYSRDGVIRYILSCCQAELGGLRDKPSAYPDAYHSCYTLAGLSAAQNTSIYRTGGSQISTYPLQAAMQWIPPEADEEVPGGMDELIYDPDDLVNSLHPVYGIPWSAVDAAHRFCCSKDSFREKNTV